MPSGRICAARRKAASEISYRLEQKKRGYFLSFSVLYYHKSAKISRLVLAAARRYNHQTKITGRHFNER